MTRVWRVAALAVVVAGCGYTLAGRSNTLPVDIRRIGVPTFKNLSTTPDLDRIFTEAIVEAFKSPASSPLCPSHGRGCRDQRQIRWKARPGRVSPDPTSAKFPHGHRGGELKKTKEDKVLWVDTVPERDGGIRICNGGAGDDLASVHRPQRHERLQGVKEARGRLLDAF